MTDYQFAINIFSNDDIIKTGDFDEEYGTEFSNSTEIKLNKTKSGYSLLLIDDNLMTFDLQNFVNVIRKIITTSLKDAYCSVSINYVPGKDLTKGVIKTICDLHDIMNDDYTSIYNIDYVTSSTISILEGLLGDEDDDEYDDEYDDYDCNYSPEWFDEDDENDDIPDWLSEAIGPDIDEDEDDEFDVLEMLGGFGAYSYETHKESTDKKNVSKSCIRRSKVLKEANKAKKTTSRHGLLVYDDKSDLKRDRETIKRMLKEFIPGDSAWIREFREEVLERWIRSYCISKKNLKRVKKYYSKQQKKKGDGKKRKTQRTSSLYDSLWNDPSR